MSISLEDFGRLPGSPQAGPESAIAAQREEDRLKAFEEGYSAGWEDAGRAHAATAQAASKAFVQSLEDMSFTYEEASSHLSGSLSRALAEVVRLVLPQCLEAALPRQINEELETAVRSSTQTRVELHCATARKALLETSLPKGLPLDLAIRADDGFDADRIELHFASSLRTIDLSDVTARVTQLIEAASPPSELERENG